MILNKNDLELVRKVIEILNEKNIKWWIDHGTLLGFEREGRPLEWDLDFDIGTSATPTQIMEDILPEIRIEGVEAHFDDTCDALKIKCLSGDIIWCIDIACYLSESGFSIKYWPSFKEFTKFQFLLFSLITFLSGGTQEVKRFYPRVLFKTLEFLLAPLNILLSRRWRRKINMRLKKFIPIKTNKVESRYFERVKIIKYKDVSLNAPELVQEYLEKRYGSTWKKPNRNWDYLISDGGLNSK